MKKLFISILFILNILNIANAAQIEKYFTYGSTSNVTNTNLNGNIDNIINVVNGALDNTNMKSGYKLFEILGTTPAAGQQGRIVYNTTDNTLNFDTGSIWNKSAIYTGTTVQGDIIYYGSGTSFALLTAGTKGQALTTGGASANPTYEGMTTQGDIEYHNGTNRTRLAVGTSGQFLQTQGASANPQWATNYNGIPSNMEAFTSNGTWTRPAGVTKVYIKLWGSGGKGGTAGGSPSQGGGGGGGGGYSEGIIAVSGNVTVTVGTAGGTANTSFVADTTIQANYGADGATGPNGAGGAGGSASGGSLNLTGITGENGSTYGGRGGDSAFGGGGGKPRNDTNAPQSGQFPGGGGSGGQNSSDAGGNGTAGLVIVYWVQ